MSTNTSVGVIEVFDKDGDRIAVFTKPTVASKSRDSIINPTVHTALDGESTFSFTILRDSKKWNDVKSPRNEWHVNGRVYKALNDTSITYSGDVITVSMVELWYELAGCYLQAHNVDLDVEAMDEHTVKILPRTDPDEFPLFVNDVEYDEDDVVDSTGSVMPRGSAGYALWAIVKGNTLGWTMGVCDVLVDGFSVEDDYGTFNLESDMNDCLTNIKNIQTLWGGVLVWDSLNKTVSLRDSDKEGTDFNVWKGFDVRYGKNMLSQPTITVDTSIITRAYVLGNNNLNIKAVNDDKTYIDNFSYTNEVIEGYIQNANIYYTGENSTSGQTQLLNWGEAELAKRCKPRENMTISLFDRRDEEEFSHEVFNIGDVVRVITKFGGETIDDKEYLRVIDWQYDVWDMSLSTITVGDRVVNMREIFKLVYDDTVDSPAYDWNGEYSADKVSFRLPDGTRVTSYAYIQEQNDELQASIDINTGYIAELGNDLVATNASITTLADDTTAAISLSASSVRSYASGKADDAYDDAVDYTDARFGYLVVSDNGVEIGAKDSNSKMYISLDNDANVMSFTTSDSGIRFSCEDAIDMYSDYITRIIGSNTLYLESNGSIIFSKPYEYSGNVIVDFSGATVTGISNVAVFG